MSEAPEVTLVRQRLEALCSRSEQCEATLRRKMVQAKLTPLQIEDVIAHLKEEDFLNEARYAAAFVRDKMRFQSWGRVKIAYALREKQVDAEVIAAALEEIDPQEEVAALQRTLASKRAGLKGLPQEEAKAKLIRFALGRGFPYSLILRNLFC